MYVETTIKLQRLAVEKIDWSKMYLLGTCRMTDIGVEDRYRALFANNVAAVGLSTPTGRMVDCNDAFTETFGFASRAEVLARSAWDFYLDRQDRDDAIQPDRVTENHAAQDLPFRHKTGRPIWLRFTRAVVRRTNNRPELLLATAVDVTELRRLRAQFRELSMETGTWPTLKADPPAHGLTEELAVNLQTVNLVLRPGHLETLTKPDLQQFIKSVERMKVLMQELVVNQLGVDREQ